ncbi:MAG: 2,3-bisphosphoglycerate-independent phosphoglycerate mutase [Candidatus Kerfeldbacteria bacterium]|nr:2,3-bisphosphoglycerate-independent phosphoglycerate mutase [Candidatus Kerfeldbacteria bacterium]
MTTPGQQLFPEGIPTPPQDAGVFRAQSISGEAHVQPAARFTGKPLTPLVLLILDGWGVAPASRGNAITLARTPNMNRLMSMYPTVTLHASGEVVGLPWAEMGNSEVGHLNIGTGKIIYQNLPMINKAISDGSFFRNDAFLQATAAVQERTSKLHIVGMVSPGGIHSSQDHVFALLEFFRNQGLGKEVFVHAILDGRDTQKDAALKSIAKLETKMHETGVGTIASLSGRFYAMDRDNHWERTEKAYNAMRHGRSEHTTDSPLKAIEESYRQHIFDEEFPPTVVVGVDGKPVTEIGDNDVVIFFNFRADRARQLTKTFVLPTFQKFDRGTPIANLMFITMTEYERNLPVTIAFQPDHARFNIARMVSEAGMRQLHIAETEKYAHVTFFFNGGSEEEYAHEDRVLIPSPRVISYAETPEMSVRAVADRIIQELQHGRYQCIVTNFANADMVGHTGNLQAAIQAIEATDEAIGRVAQQVLNMNGTLVVTADHGNAEEMINLQTGEIDKEHSTNPVPCIMANSLLASQRSLWPPVLDGNLSSLQPVGVLSDVAPTVLQLLGIQPPSEMTSRSLIR